MMKFSDADRDLLARIVDNADKLDTNARKILHALIPLVNLDPTDVDYQDAIYPFDPKPQRRPLAIKQSGCGLTTEGGWRGAEVDEPLLYVPVGPRSIAGGRQYPVALERDDAMRWGCWTDTRIWTGETTPLPPEGAAVIIGCGACAGVWSRNTFASEHEFTNALWLDDGVAVSIDGGQPGIRLRTRRYVEVIEHQELWVADLDATIAADGRPSKGRRVLGWTNPDGLHTRAAAVAA